LQWRRAKPRNPTRSPHRTGVIGVIGEARRRRHGARGSVFAFVPTMRTKDSCWSVGTIYDPRELPGVSTVGPGIGRGVTSGIRADPRGFTGVCGLGVRVYGAWHMWVRIDHMAWHMTTLDTQTWLRGEVSGLGLTDEDVGFLRGVDCDILAPRMGYPCPKLNRINRVIISIRCIFFFGSLSRKNLQIKRAWLGAIWDE
jgi:hypothetical protein